MKKDVFFMKHDINASRDDRVLEMRAAWGVAGYGMYWLVNEFLREQTDCMASLKKINLIAFSMNLNPNDLETFITACIDEYELYESDGNLFWSNRMISDKLELDRVRHTNSRNAKKGWEKRRRSTIPEESECDRISDGEADEEPEDSESDAEDNASAMQLRRERKKGKKEGNSHGPFGNVKMEDADFQQLVDTFGRGMTDLLIEKLANYKKAHGKNYTSDFGAIHKWVVKAVKEDIRGDPGILAKANEHYRTKVPELRKCMKCGGAVISNGDAARCGTCHAFFELHGGEWRFIEFSKIPAMEAGS